MSTHPLETVIDTAFERRADINSSTASRELLAALDTVIGELNAGRLRVAEKIGRHVDDASMDQESGAAVFPHARQPDDPRCGNSAVVRQGAAAI
jgi:hypothetical protein